MDLKLANDFTSAIGRITNTDDSDGIFTQLNNRITELHRIAARNFHLGLEVSFRDAKTNWTYTGVVDNINKDGKIKVKFPPGSRYASYSIGAQTLTRWMNNYQPKP